MYEVHVEIRFHASHQVRMFDGQLEPLHSHNWRAEAVFRGPDLDEIGVLVDFVAVKRALEEVVRPLSGSRLNDAPVLGGSNPTAEVVARHVFETLYQRLDPSAPLRAVYIEEAPGCVAGWLDSRP